MEYEKVEIVQNRGPRLQFEGRLLASSSFAWPAKGLTRDLRIWETRGGSLVAASYSRPDDGDGRDFIEASVIEPGPDEQVRQFAVLDHFEWSDRARSMVRTQLKWKLTQRVA